MSISVWSSMCPMCSEPVTFGGGGCECAGAGVFDRDSAAERDGLAAHRAHAGPHGDRHPHALAQDAGIQHALFAGNRPRVNLDATRGGTAIGGARNRLPEIRARRIPEEGLEVERRVGRHDHPADETDWRELRLVAREVYVVTGIVARGYGSVRAALRRRTDLPGKPVA